MRSLFSEKLIYELLSIFDGMERYSCQIFQKKLKKQKQIPKNQKLLQKVMNYAKKCSLRFEMPI